MKKNAIIVAGGKGARMGSELPKQFIELNKKPILMHSISAFFNYDPSITIIVVLPKNQISFWNELCVNHNFDIAHTVVEGGEERFHSVQNGLKLVHEGVVGIHDGVRPLVSKDTLENCYSTATQQGNAIPVIDIVETIRKINGNESTTVNRSDYKLVQTPQCFHVDVIKRAYLQPYNYSFTDDASLVEHLGEKINLVSGNRENIKITTPSDIKIAEALL